MCVYLVNMRAVYFPDWQSALLEDGSLGDRQRVGYQITIRWFLGYCKRGHQGATIEQGHSFLAEAVATKQPNEWVHQQWKDAMNWFFMTAKRLGVIEDVENRGSEGVGEHVAEGRLSGCSASSTQRGPRSQSAQLMDSEPEWKLEFIRLIRIRHMSYQTEKTYMNWLERLAKFHKTQALKSLPESALTQFLDYLAVVKHVSDSTQRQALNALVFLYREVFEHELGDFSNYRRASAKKSVRVVLTLEEIERLLAELEPLNALMACLQYGAGLRVSELMRLRIKDMDFERGQVIVRAGKGNKDRVTLLPQSLLPALKRHREAIRKLYELDRKQGVAGVYLPPALARKYKYAGERWEWFWFWPAKGLSEDPRARGTVRRHHVLQKVYQEAVTRAARSARFDKHVTSHALRHSFATHLMESGTDTCRVQELLGHADLETTRLYLHVMQKQMDSPADKLSKRFEPE